MLRAPLGPAEAYMRMLAAFGEDIAATVSDHGERDPFALRDPVYIERTLPAVRLASQLYFRADVRGLEHIPPEGPVLLVGNHSGGTLIADTFVFGQYFYDRFGAQRRFHQLAHDLVFKVPGLRALVERYGTVPASPANMASALRRNAALLVYPGGDHETYRPSWESDQIDFAHRTGFVSSRSSTASRSAGGGDRRPGDGTVPRPGTKARAGAQARRAPAPEGAARRDRPAARTDGARSARTHPAAGQDFDPCTEADRPARPARLQPRSRRGVQARHLDHAAHADEAVERARRCPSWGEPAHRSLAGAVHAAGDRLGVDVPIHQDRR